MKSGDKTEFDSEVVQAFAESKTGAGAFRGEWRHGKSASSAYWDPRGRRIVSTSYDDLLRGVFSILAKRLEVNPLGQCGTLRALYSRVRRNSRHFDLSVKSNTIVKLGDG